MNVSPEWNLDHSHCADSARAAGVKPTPTPGARPRSVRRSRCAPLLYTPAGLLRLR